MSSPQVFLGNGVQTRFEVPGSVSKVVRVNGVITAPASTDAQSVTMSVAPGLGVTIQIDWVATAQVGLVVPADNALHAYSNTQFNCGGLVNGQNVLLDSVVIPGGTLGPNSLIEIYAMYSFPGAGGNGKDPLIRIGPSSGTFATAQNILNNQGFSTQKAFIVDIRGHNKGSLASNVWTPSQGNGWGNQAGNSPVSYAIDFSQPVTVYFGGTCTNTFGDPTDIVRLETYSITISK